MIRDTEDPTTSTPTPTTTIGHARSPRSKQIQGKLSRPRRRGHRSVSNLNLNNQLNSSSMERVRSADCSLTSIDSTSDKSRQSRYTTASKNSGTGGSFSRSKSVANSLHNSFSSNSVFGLTGGSTYSKTIVPLSQSFSQNGKESKTDSYEYHHKHYYNPESQHYEPYTTMSSPSSASSSLPPLPSLKVILCELSLICSLYCRYGMQFVRKPCKLLRQRLLHGGLSLIIIVLGLGTWLCYDFYTDVVDICVPPTSSRSPTSNFNEFLAYMDGHPYMNNSYVDDSNETHSYRPLVEYYVHGRGIGHYARSVAIVEQLNRAGVDVRMFLTRASMWRALHEDNKIIVDTDVHQETHQLEEGQNHQQRFLNRGKTTAIPIISLVPGQGFLEGLSRILERISGDCEVAATSGRYPQLVISDGDLPGMIRAKLGSIPSVGIAHGQLFSIAQKPQWVKESSQLNDAWNSQGFLNHASGYFTQWQIATHFCFLESRYHSGTVARPPLRPEVLLMAEARKWARQGKLPPNRNSDDKDRTKSNSIDFDRFPLPQAERVREILLTTDATAVSTAVSNATLTRHRKIVICYFRDNNGEDLVQALLDADFDVLLFDTGYTKDMANNPYRYGAKWMIEDEFVDQERKKYIPDEDKVIRDANQLRGRNDVHKGTTSNSTLRVEGHGFEVHSSEINGPRLIQVMDRSLFVPLMHVADGVASSAGSQLMSECIYSHMPLLAIYKEDDSEQHLNVEMSHHVNAPCHRPLVFGDSFESLTFALRSNRTPTTAKAYKTKDNREVQTVLDSFKKFVDEVRASSVSYTYFQNAHILDNNDEINMKRNGRFGAQKENMSSDNEDSISSLDDEDPFRGLPDAAAIILEIVKQVAQKR